MFCIQYFFLFVCFFVCIALVLYVHGSFFVCVCVCAFVSISVCVCIFAVYFARSTTTALSFFFYCDFVFHHTG